MKKNILITGGGSGIGKKIAVDLSLEGNNVFICGRRNDFLEEVANNNKNIAYHICDVSKEEEVKKLVTVVGNCFSKIDVIINSAGVQGEIGRIDRTDVKNWINTIQINLFGTYFIIRYFLDFLLKSSTRKIINFAGGGAFNPFPNYSAYAVSKAGIVRLTENIAEELSSLGVKVNCIAPGFIKTDIHNQTLSAGATRAGEQYFEFTKRKLEEGSVPIEKPVECIKFLISNESNQLTGKTISASFDKWNSPVFKKYIDDINDSNLYTLQRINLRNLEKKYQQKDFYKKLIELYR